MTRAEGLSAFIRAHEREILARWVTLVVQRLELQDTEEPELVDDMPDFLREIAACLERAPPDWPPSAAHEHGRQRHGLGLDLGELVQEFELLGEALLAVAREHDADVSTGETLLLFRLVARGIRASVEEYVEQRDREYAERAASEFSFVAHELRTPLHTARLALELLSSRTEADAPYLGHLRRALDEIASLIDNRITESRLKGEVEPHIERLDCRELVRDALDGLRMAAERRSIELVDELDDCELDGDRKLLSSVLVNLVNNAIKFSRDGCAVRVHVRSAGERVRMRVEDACGGIPEPELAGLFEPFVQSGSDRSGFGLGLTIVRQAVQAHGGEIDVENMPGRGCAFVVELPRRQDARDAPGAG
jgi:signal transduction histidine kinase